MSNLRQAIELLKFMEATPAEALRWVEILPIYSPEGKKWVYEQYFKEWLKMK
jgi:hypothetical protein